MDNEVKFNKERVSFSRSIKRKILLEIANGKNPNKVLMELANIPKEKFNNDKKYATKLIHKWRKEMYENKEILNILNHDLNQKIIEDEIVAIGDDKEEDIIILNINNYT